MVELRKTTRTPVTKVKFFGPRFEPELPERQQRQTFDKYIFHDVVGKFQTSYTTKRFITVFTTAPSLDIILRQINSVHTLTLTDLEPPRVKKIKCDELSI